MTSINKALCEIMKMHRGLDSQVKSLRKDLVEMANKPSGRILTARDFVAGRTAAVGAKICDLSLSLGCGISVKDAMRAAAGNVFEKYRVGFMTRGRSGTLLQLASTAAVLGAKVGLLAAGTLVVAPLVGLAWGLHSWSQQGADWNESPSGHVESPSTTQASAAAGARRRPDGVQLAEVMARQGARTVAAF